MLVSKISNIINDIKLNNINNNKTNSEYINIINN